MGTSRDVNFYINKLNLEFDKDLQKYEPDFDLPYILLGSFALFVSDLIKENSVDNIKLKTACEFIEEMAKDTNEEVQDLFMIGFLEVFIDEKSSLEFAKTYLSHIVNDKIDLIQKFWQ
jgi:hypothetical protein